MPEMNSADLALFYGEQRLEAQRASEPDYRKITDALTDQLDRAQEDDLTVTLGDLLETIGLVKERIGA